MYSFIDYIDTFVEDAVHDSPRNLKRVELIPWNNFNIYECHKKGLKHKISDTSWLRGIISLYIFFSQQNYELLSKYSNHWLVVIFKIETVKMSIYFYLVLKTWIFYKRENLWFFIFAAFSVGDIFFVSCSVLPSVSFPGH